ncbi:nuclear transport factor 2 family protein [uncultured Aquimarina sp.]|uniref:nuclear transport factor 2 family protein n=1 Tax=uncultured Aquimarina sp. TaxID=575652 RepID=UPI002622B1DC|nr:nuclear transport factor 2 family protein [uncultured Aquimarina sp.]
MSKIKYIYPTLLLLFFSFYTFAQKESLHKKINQDMYGNFSEAFEKLDYSLFASIHSDEMIRISGGNGGEIKSVKKYLEGYQKRWSDPNRKASPIDFRLFERVTSDSLVSDRGIYRVTYKNDKGETKFSYGQFHVLLRMENGSWKILTDYDSNEQNTINKQSYDTAFPLSDYKKYWKHRD